MHLLLFLGVPYADYIGFQDWMTSFSEAKYSWSFLESVLEKVPGLIENLRKYS